MNETKPVKMGYEGRLEAAQVSLGDDLWELHAAGAKIAEFTDGRTLAEYESHEALRAAAERMLTIMSEAALRIAEQSAEQASRLGDVAGLHSLAGRIAEQQTTNAEVWRFLREVLPGLSADAQVELERWHEG